MLEIANDQGVVLLINHSRRWDKLYQDISDYIKEGNLGDIQQASCYYTAGIANTCSHLFDVLRMLFGDVVNVCSWYKDNSKKDDPNMDGYHRTEPGPGANPARLGLGPGLRSEAPGLGDNPRHIGRFGPRARRLRRRA